MIPTGREASRPGPYRGLNSYTEEDAYYFFGRSRERQLITAHLQAHRLTLLYGPTGVGKSSVLRAGVAADLLEDAWREKDELRTPEFLPVVFSAWGDDPLAAIVESIRLAVLEFLPSPSKLPESLSIAETIETGVRLSGARLLVILDQFEEYFSVPRPAARTEHICAAICACCSPAGPRGRVSSFNTRGQACGARPIPTRYPDTLRPLPSNRASSQKRRTRGDRAPTHRLQRSSR